MRESGEFCCGTTTEKGHGLSHSSIDRQGFPNTRGIIPYFSPRCELFALIFLSFTQKSEDTLLRVSSLLYRLLFCLLTKCLNKKFHIAECRQPQSRRESGKQILHIGGLFLLGACHGVHQGGVCGHGKRVEDGHQHFKLRDPLAFLNSG